MSHTPGPWTIDDAGPDSGNLIRGEVYGPRRQMIAELPCPHANRDNHVSPKQWLANARLIAAAPDMLRACIRCERELARLAQDVGDRDSSEQKTQGAWTLGFPLRLCCGRAGDGSPSPLGCQATRLTLDQQRL